MAWTDWFKKVVIQEVFVSPECEEVKEELASLKRQINASEAILRKKLLACAVEDDKHVELRHEVSLLQSKIAEMRNTPDYQALEAIIEAQTDMNKRMTETVKEYARREMEWRRKHLALARNDIKVAPGRRML